MIWPDIVRLGQAHNAPVQLSQKKDILDLSFSRTLHVEYLPEDAASGFHTEIC